MEEARAKGEEVLPVPEVFHQHDASILSQHASSFTEKMRAMLRGAHLVSGEEKKHCVTAIFTQRQRVQSSLLEGLCGGVNPARSCN
jgi:hypothetical protein